MKKTPLTKEDILKELKADRQSLRLFRFGSSGSKNIKLASSLKKRIARNLTALSIIK